MTPEDAKLLGMVDENPDLALQKIYDQGDISAHNTISVPNIDEDEEPEDPEEAAVNSEGSVDMEEVLK